MGAILEYGSRGNPYYNECACRRQRLCRRTLQRHIAGGQTTVILHLGAYGSAYFSATCVPRRCYSARIEARRGVKSFWRRSCVWLSTRAKRVPVPGEEREGWRLWDLELGYSTPSACHIGPLINDKLSLCLHPIIKAFKAGLNDIQEVYKAISGATCSLRKLVVVNSGSVQLTLSSHNWRLGT